MMKRVLAWGMAVLGAVAAARGEVGREERETRWREMFGYCQRVEWRYDGEGRVVKVDAVAEAEERAKNGEEGDGEGIDPDGWAAECASEGDAGRKASVLGWLAAEREVPGETVLVAGAEAGGVWVLSERGVESRCLKRYEAASGRVECLVQSGEGRELVGPVFSPDGAGGVRLAGLTWRSVEGVWTEWKDEAMEAASRRVEAAWPGATGLDWVAHAGEEGAGRWIVRARSAVRPPVWLEVDVAGEGIRVLSEGPEGVSPTVRRVVRWEASDGMPMDGVFTRPAREGRCPLVVFPHGGPGAVSSVDFDERAWALADAGFAVFQPNYRGSAGRGKAFRLAGWGAEGIRRAMRDIREGAAAVMADEALGVAEGKAALLGGSWGGYCVLEQLALFPEAYAGGAAFFGAYDLPALVESEAARIGRSGDCGAEKVWAMRGLWRQFADPADGEGMAALAEISPIRQLEGIRGPVWLFHKRGDGTIPFEQSERLFGEMSRRGMAVTFREGEGSHGFGPEEEAGVYAELAEAFRGMRKNQQKSQ